MNPFPPARETCVLPTHSFARASTSAGASVSAGAPGRFPLPPHSLRRFSCPIVGPWEPIRREAPLRITSLVPHGA